MKGGDYSTESQYGLSVDNLSIPEATRANDQFKTILEVRNTGVRTIGGFELTSSIGGVATTHAVDKVLLNGQSAKVEIMVPVGDVEGNIDFSVKAKIKNQAV